MHVVQSTVNMYQWNIFTTSWVPYNCVSFLKIKINNVLIPVPTQAKFPFFPFHTLKYSWKLFLNGKIPTTAPNQHFLPMYEIWRRKKTILLSSFFNSWMGLRSAGSWKGLCSAAAAAVAAAAGMAAAAACQSLSPLLRTRDHIRLTLASGPEK